MKDNSPLKELKERVGNLDIIDRNDSFKFTCKACGKCCHNRNEGQTIIVSPYDMFRIVKNANPEDPTAFIQKHFDFYIGDSSGLLIASLKIKDLFNGENICTFLKKRDGSLKCSIHSHKPSACRLFPLGRMIDAKGKEVTYFLQKDIHCNMDIKEEERDEHTLKEWMPDMEETEEAFFEFSNMVGRLEKVIVSRKIKNSDKIPLTMKHVYYEKLDEYLYIKYDYSKDFKEQFKKNVDDLIDFAKNYKRLLIPYEPKIRPKKERK